MASDYLTFVASVIRSLAWPLAIVVLGIIFKAPISRFIDRIRHAKRGDLELDLAAEALASATEIVVQAEMEKVREAEVEGGETPRVKNEELQGAIESMKDLRADLRRLRYGLETGDDPMSVMISADIELAAAVNMYARQVLSDGPEVAPADTVGLTAQLVHAGMISPSLQEAILGVFAFTTRERGDVDRYRVSTILGAVGNIIDTLVALLEQRYGFAR